MFAAILFFISVGAFLLSRYAGKKAKDILVSHTITVNEEQIAALGLYKGLELRLGCAGEKDMINVFVTDARGQEVLLGQFSSYVEYDILRKKNIRAFVFAISGNKIAVEVKLNEAL
jgi:hypothetical protein